MKKQLLIMTDISGKINFRLGSVNIRTEPVKLTFPDYKAIIKGLKNDKKVLLNTKVFHVSLRKGLTVAKYNKEAKNGGILDFRGGRLTIKAKDGFAVEYRDTIDTVQTEGRLKNLTKLKIFGGLFM